MIGWSVRRAASSVSKWATVCLAAGLFLSHSLAVAQDGPPPPPPIEQVGAEGEPLFHMAHPNLTFGREGWSKLVSFRPPEAFQRVGMTAVDLDEYDNDTIRKGIEEWVINWGMGWAAQEKFLKMEPRGQEEYELARDSLAIYCWLESEGLLDVDNVPEEEIVKEYELRKGSYAIAEEMRFRQVFLSTYKEYEVKEGDTLESIALAQSGSADAVENILEAATKTPRIKDVETVEGETVGPRALVPGEKLLVPMNDEEAAAIGKRMEEIAARLRAGADFDEVEQEVSEADLKGRPFIIRPAERERPLLPAINDAFFSTADGGISDPFRTKHGWQVLRRDSYIAAGTRPLEEVRDELRAVVAARWRNEQITAKLQGIWDANRADILEVNEEVLAESALPDRAEQVILEYNGQSYRAAAFERDFASRLTPETTLEEKIAMLATLGGVQQAIFEFQRAILDIDNWDLYRARLRMVELEFLGFAYQNFMAKKAADWYPSGEEMRAHYDANPGKYLAPPAADVYQITLNPDVPEDASDTQVALAIQEKIRFLGGELEKVKTLEQFQDLARKVSQHESASKGGDVGRIDRLYLNGVGQRLIFDEPAGTVVGPFPKDKVVHAFWTVKKYDKEPATYDQAIGPIAEELRMKHRSDERMKLRNGMIEKAKLEFFLDDAKAAAE